LITDERETLREAEFNDDSGIKVEGRNRFFMRQRENLNKIKKIKEKRKEKKQRKRQNE
jgi:hypothetical protein